MDWTTASRWQVSAIHLIPAVIETKSSLAADITLPKIPAIRQITNSVLLDIPLFMSQHRQAMIEAVCVQANKAYRKWCARNPDFDGKGRVHIIGHSVCAQSCLRAMDVKLMRAVVGYICSSARLWQHISCRISQRGCHHLRTCPNRSEIVPERSSSCEFDVIFFAFARS